MYDLAHYRTISGTECISRRILDCGFRSIFRLGMCGGWKYRERGRRDDHCHRKEIAAIVERWTRPFDKYETHELYKKKKPSQDILTCMRGPEGPDLE